VCFFILFSGILTYINHLLADSPLILHGFSVSQDWKQDGQISPETKKQVGKAINEISKDA